MKSTFERRQDASAALLCSGKVFLPNGLDKEGAVPQLCRFRHCNSLSCWECQQGMHSSQSAEAMEAEQIVPYHVRSSTQQQLQGKHHPVRHADAFQQTPWALEPAGTSAASGFRRSRSASLCQSESVPHSGRSSPAAVRPDSQSALLSRLTVPVVEPRRQGRKRSMHRDSGSTTDLASCADAAQPSCQESPVSDTCSDPLPVLNSSSLDFFSLQQVPRYSLTGGSLLTSHPYKRRRSSSEEQETELAGPGAGMQGAAVCHQEPCGSPSGSPAEAGAVPWLWQPSWEARQDPVPARLVEVASIQRPHKQSINADVLSSVEFSQDGMLLATAGRAKQVNVYSMASLDDEDGEANCPRVAHHRLPSKLSSLAWSPSEPGMVTVGDYDGGLSQLDLSSGQWMADREENDGRRLWSVAHSSLQPHLVACASDSGCIRLWTGNGLATNAVTIFPGQGAPVCGVAFSSLDEHLLAAASADSNAYVYDIRHSSKPLQVLEGHTHAVSFVRFLRHQLVTASIDGTLGWWDLGNPHNTPGETSSQDALGAPVKRLRALRGHANAQNFVGLAVREHDRLIACGSERGSAYVYHTSWDTPVAHAPALSRRSLHSQASGAQHALQQLQLQNSGSGAMSSASGAISSAAGLQPPVSRLAHGQLEDHTGLVSAVAWRPVVSQWKPRAFLAAASSTGDLGVLSLEVFEQMV